MKLPIVSVIIPIYNTEEFLRKCLNSVVGQTFSDMEIICVLDGPTDGSPGIVREYAERDSRIVIVEQPNAGLSVARNAGIEKAAGEYLAFVDSDDWIEPNYVKGLVDAALAHDAGMVICNYYNYKDGPVPEKDIPEGVYDAQAICRELIKDYLFRNYLWNKLIRKELFTKNGIVFPVGLLFEDMAVVSLIAHRAGKIAVVNERLYYYRQRDGSIVNSFNRRRFLEIFTILKKLREDLKKDEVYELYETEFELNCVNKLLTNARIICRDAPQHVELLEEIERSFDAIFDGRKRISPRTKTYLSTHSRISLWAFRLNRRFFYRATVRKLI